jgi:hypothetical protein
MEPLDQMLTTLFAILAGAVTLGLLLRIGFILGRRGDARRPIHRAGKRWLAARALLIVSLLLLAAGVLHSTAIMLPLSPVAAPLVRISFYILAVVWIGLELVRLAAVPERALGSTPRLLFSVIAAIAIASVGLVMLRGVPEVHAYPADSDSIVLQLPTEGRWLAAHAGGSASTNHHNRIRSQRYAADLVRLGPDGRIFDGTPGTTTSHTWGAPILAPATGRVVTAIDGFPDDIRPERREDVGGNYVAIEVAPERYVIVAHLMNGSVAVREGQHVSAGELLGRAGNSGNSDFPHLHIHVQDRPTVDFEANAFPYRFEQLRRKRWMLWRVTTRAELIRNDLFEPAG